MRRLGIVFLLSVLVVGCQDRRSATAPDGTALPGGIAAAISDGAHNGTEGFFFLPPLVDNPSSLFQAGRFNPGLKPVVDVYEYAASGSPVGGANGCTFTGGERRIPLGVASVEGGSEHYSINWNTRASNLNDNKTYRVCVFTWSAGVLLGYLDVQPVAGGMRNARTLDTYVFQDDRTLPIKFRIEMGAVCAENALECTAGGVVGSTADTVVLPSRHAAVVIPSGSIAADDTVTIVIAKQAPPYTGEGTAQCLPGDLQQSRGCYHFSTVPPNYQFLAPVRIEACVNVEGLTPGQVNQLLLHKYNGTGEPVPLPRADTTEIDCSSYVLGAADANVPTSLAGAVWRGAQRLFADVVSPRALHAAPMAIPPKGLGGLAGSFSDVGGAVPNVPAGVVSWWTAEGHALDLYRLNDGEMMNGTTYAQGIAGSAFKFDGSDDFVRASDVTVIDTMQRLSVELWVNLDELGDHDERFVTISPERVVLRYDAGRPGQLHFYMNFGTRDAPPPFERIFVPEVLRTGCFEHVVGTYDGNHMRVYLNGDLVGSHAVTGTVVRGLHDNLEIGSDNAQTKGAVDEVRIFNRALTAAEVAADYAAGAQALKCPPLPPLLPADMSSSLSFAAHAFGSTDWDVYRVDPDARTWTDLSPDGEAGAIDLLPAWFPSGGTLAFSSNRAGMADIYTMRRDGSSVTRLTTTGRNRYAAVSPRDSSIAFVRDNGDARDIWVMGWDGSSQRVLVSDGSYNLYPAWSPDGTRIAFGSNRTGGYEIYLMNADGSNPQRLTSQGGGEPAWSPAGDRIAFTCATPDGSEPICTMNPDGSDVQPVTDNARVAEDPAWSPDGNWIAFKGYPAGDLDHSDIYLVHPDGSGLRRVTDGTMGYAEPSWPLAYRQIPQVIDGVLGEPGWATATTFSFNANLPGGGTRPATLYAWNDTTNLYLAVRLEGTGFESSLAFEFDNDNDGVAENGNDVILLNPPHEFHDEFRTNLPPCTSPAEAACGFHDTDYGGFDNGAGAFRSDGSFSVYEMSHPLNSGDVGHDFSLASGQTVGMYLFLRMANWPLWADTYLHGSNSLYLQIAIR